MAGSAKKNLQDALLGVLRSSEPAAMPWRPKLLKALTALGAGDAAQTLVVKLERQAVKEERWAASSGACRWRGVSLALMA